MKKFPIIPCILAVLSIIAAAGSRTFLGACRHEDGAVSNCQLAGRVLTCIAVITAVLSLVSLLWKSSEAKAAAYISIAVVSTAALWIPGNGIPLCRMDTMRCRTVMHPAMLLLFGLMAAVSLAGAALEFFRVRRN